MSRTRLHSTLVTRTPLFLALTFVSLSTFAQTAQEVSKQLAKSARTPDEAAIQTVFVKGYEAYAKKDASTLFSLFSERSPYLPGFKEFFQKELVRNERIKIQWIRVFLMRHVNVEGDNAVARVFVEIRAVDTETGKTAEGFGEMEHTLRFIRESGVWKLWQYVHTAEELTIELLAAGPDEERSRLIVAKYEPFNGGLLNGLLNQAQALLEEKADYTNATTIFNTALNIAKRLNSPAGGGGALVGLGDVYSAQGDYLRAANNYHQVMKLAESYGSKEGIAAVSVKLGNIHYQQGNFVQAMEFYQRSAKLYEAVGSKTEIAYPLVNIGNAYFSLGDYAQALAYYQRSLKIYQQLFDKAGIAYLLNRIGEIHAAQGNHGEAVENYQQSLKLHEELGNRAMVAHALNNIGNVRHSQGKFKEADELSTRAADLARANESPEILWQAMTSAGRARRDSKQLDRAREAFSEAITVIEQLRNRAVGSEQDKQLFFEGRTSPYYAMVDLLIAQENWEKSFAYSERAKGRVLLDILDSGRESISRAMTPDERAQERRLNDTVIALNSQLSRASLGSHPDAIHIANTKSRLKNARLELEAFQTQKYAAHPELKIQRGQVELLTLDEVGSLIPDSKTAFLEFTVTREKVYLFVITRGVGANGSSQSDVEMKVYTLNIQIDELTKLIAEFRTRLADNSLNFRELARQLYDVLIRPAESQLNGKTTLCIVPDSALWDLPFQALQPREDKYLLEDHALFYAPSFSVLRAMKRRGPSVAANDAGPGLTTANTAATKIKTNPLPSNRALLALGNPELAKSIVAQTGSLDRDTNLKSLPEAEREVKSLAQFYDQSASKILIRKEAREDIFKAEAGRYRVLHLATHGTMDDHNPMYSRLMLSSTGVDEDGVLEAREIINLDLHADLVVLSACQTARGRAAAGEGLIGMSWAFFIAGTPTTVASQWKVDSASTTLLMSNFHRILRSDEPSGGGRISKAAALREAALRILASPQHRHPFYWAAFVVIGDGT